jgi:uncharacterized membrane protein YkgB
MMKLFGVILVGIIIVYVLELVLYVADRQIGVVGGVGAVGHAILTLEYALPKSSKYQVL